MVGLRLQHYIVLASDGYAVYQTEDAGLVSKTDSYSKLRILAEGRLVIGSAGSHAVAFEVCDNVGSSISGDVQSEESFLQQFADEVRKVNDNPDGRKTAFLLAYLALGKPRIVLLKPDGAFEVHSTIAAIGSGANVALDYLCPRYDPYWGLGQAVGEIVEAIYVASQVPTVNFIPMVVVVGPDRPVDLSPLAVNLLGEFRDKLKRELMWQAEQIV